MRILFATHDYPFPITYGGQVYSGNVVRNLAKQADDLGVVCFHPGIAEVERFEAEGARWTRVPLRKPPGRPMLLLSPLPALAAKHVDERYWALIADELASGPDYLIIDYIAIGWIADRARKLIATRGLKTLVLYMSHNVETLLRRQIAASHRGGPLMRLLASYDAARAARLERGLAASDVVSVETGEDAATFHALFAPKRVVLAPPGYAGEMLAARTIDAATPRNAVVLGGRLSTMKRIVLDELLAVAAARIAASGCGLHIVGPMTEAHASAARARYPAATVHGFVADVAPLLRRMRVGIVADHVGGGFKHRILTHVFSRVPMIAPPEVMAGLPLMAGEDYHPVACYEDVPGAVAAVIDDTARLDAYQNHAFERCRGAFSWSETMTRFAGTLRELMPAA